MHSMLSLVKNLLCACPGQIPRYSGLEYQSYYFALLKKLSNTCPLKLLLHRGGAKLEIGNWEEQYKSINAQFLISTFRERLQVSFAQQDIHSLYRDCLYRQKSPLPFRKRGSGI